MKAFIYHSIPTHQLGPLGSRISELSGEELRLAIDVLGASCDPSYLRFLTPLTDHADPAVRVQVAEIIEDMQSQEGT
jgi:hypothetical protein